MRREDAGELMTVKDRVEVRKSAEIARHVSPAGVPAYLTET